MARKRTTKVERYLVIPYVGEYRIIGEDGIYWYCEESQFFKFLGYEVIEREVEEEAVEEEK